MSDARRCEYTFQTSDLHPRLLEVLARRRSSHPTVARAKADASNDSQCDVSRLCVRPAPVASSSTPPPTPPSDQPATATTASKAPISPAITQAPTVVAQTEPRVRKESQHRCGQHPTSVAVHSTPSLEPANGPRPTANRPAAPISVHALGKYAFCPRAGVLASESADDTDPDEDPLRLDYLPNYDLELIEEQIARLVRQWFIFLMLMLVGMVAAQICMHWQAFWPLQGSLLATLLLAYRWLEISLDKVVLCYRRQQAAGAKPEIPIESLQTPQAVCWWSLLKAGFESHAYPQPIQHPELPVEGNPWRVLHYGSLRIPVIRAGGRKLGPANNQLFGKYEVRLCAYALLLTAQPHIRTPYAVIFPAHSTQGLAIPMSPEFLQRARRFIVQAASASQQAQAKLVIPAMPANRAHCLGCSYGRPTSMNPIEIQSARQQPGQVLVLSNGRGSFFHCACGDRFQAAPPHRRILNKGLAAIVQ